MNDRELLELAAKAAGIEVEWSDITGCFWSDGDSWVPLTDDGDALRLAVKLGLCVRIDNRVGFSWVKGFEGSTSHDNDPYAATRRAIVRAAAIIGESL